VRTFQLIAAIIIPVLTSAGANGPVDPGVRKGASNAGQPLPGLTADETAYFNDGAARFMDVEVVTGGANNGLGPRFNGNQCAECHMQPAIGGSSPMENPTLALATLDGAKNTVPWFLVKNGPIREARFKKNPNGTPDGGVHAIFTISGRKDAQGCSVAQPDFAPAGNPLTGLGGNRNLSFRIATPLFGLGLVEAIPDSIILTNSAEDGDVKRRAGVHGHANAHISGAANLSPNDGTITRFGWKAQNKSLLIFAAEAYNVEMGITNELFPQERDYTAGCLYNATPEDATNFTPTVQSGTPPYYAVLSDIEAFADFMRMLAPPNPAPDTDSTARGRELFAKVGCTYCHTPTLMTAKAIASGGAKVPSAALSNQPVHLYSDVLVHKMGKALGDGIVQGSALGDEFRTAPLWGVGQRVFFMHDGRTSDLVEAIKAHKSPGSEASRVVEYFQRLKTSQQQDVINFLRGL
jgi:CxxC motif-containing protein (DUF1111 family)